MNKLNVSNIKFSKKSELKVNQGLDGIMRTAIAKINGLETEKELNKAHFIYRKS